MIFLLSLSDLFIFTFTFLIPEVIHVLERWVHNLNFLNLKSSKAMLAHIDNLKLGGVCACVPLSISFLQYQDLSPTLLSGSQQGRLQPSRPLDP